jgi:ankyrin repeat protein
MANSQPADLALFFEACANDDVEVLRGLLANDSGLARASNPEGHYPDWTGLHSAAQGGHVDAVRLLLEHGADPDAREAGDNTCPLHWAAAAKHVATVRALLDAGGEVHGIGDVHELDVIGWATVFSAPGHDPREVVSLLLERGARHHIFSAIAVGDLDLIRGLVTENPKALDRRMSRFEHGQTPLHFAISQNRYDILDLLIELGADLDGRDISGNTAFEVAMLRGDEEAIARLHAAGATLPTPIDPSSFQTSVAALAQSTRKVFRRSASRISRRPSTGTRPSDSPSSAVTKTTGS